MHYRNGREAKNGDADMPDYSNLSRQDLTAADRKQIDAGSKRWAVRFRDRKRAIQQSERITRDDLAVQINEKS